MRLALGVAALIHLGMIASLVAQPTTVRRLFNDTYNRPGPAADFFAVYHAGRQVLTGRDPYAEEERPRRTPTFAPFRYPPGVAFTVGVAFAWARPWVAYAAWIVLLEALLLLDLLLMRSLFTDRRVWALVAAGWLAFTPYFVELWMGQFTFATASLVFIALVCWRRARPRTAAALWACAAVLKLFPLALTPLLVRQRRLAAIGGAGLLLALALAWFLWHPAQWRQFVALNFTGVDLRTFHAGNFGLQAFLYDVVSLLGPVGEGAWRWLTGGLATALIAAASLAMIRRGGADARVSAAIALLLLPLGFRHVWEHHYVVVLPALALLASAWETRPRRLIALAAAWLVLALPSPLILLQSGTPTWFPEQQWSAPVRALYHAPRPLATLAVFAFCCWEQLRAPAARPA
jgi:hypothetical protein